MPENIDAAVAVRSRRAFDLPIGGKVIFDGIFLLALAPELLARRDENIAGNIFARLNLAAGKAVAAEAKIQCVQTELAVDGLLQIRPDEISGGLQRSEEPTSELQSPGL